MEIEIVNVGPRGDSKLDRYKLSIDGVIDESSSVFDATLYLESRASIEKFKSLKVKDFTF